MAIKDEMFKAIENEINRSMEEERFPGNINVDRTKEVAKMLTSLSVEQGEAGTLMNQYLANIKIICSAKIEDKSSESEATLF